MRRCLAKVIIIFPTSEENQVAKIAIIGAGLSGITAAKLLESYAEVIVFEKAQSVSGRMSTRRAEPYSFDHGAQYFTARTQSFQKFISPLISNGVIQRWNARYVKFDGDKIIERKDWGDEENEPRFVGVPSMNKMVKHLAKDLNVLLNTRIVTLRRDGKWQLLTEKNQVHDSFDLVISTAPSAQTADLLPMEFQYHNEINNIQMQPCFSLMLGFSEPLNLGFDAAHVFNSDLSWLSINSHKPGRPRPYTLLIHSSAEYAESHLDDDRDDIIKHLCTETGRIIGCDVSFPECKILHSWLYANNIKRRLFPVFFDQGLQLGACGDWCVGGRVEGAFTAAYNLVEKIKESIL